MLRHWDTIAQCSSIISQKNGNFNCMTENLKCCFFVIVYYGFKIFVMCKKVPLVMICVMRSVFLRYLDVLVLINSQHDKLEISVLQQRVTK